MRDKNVKIIEEYFRDNEQKQEDRIIIEQVMKHEIFVNFFDIDEIIEKIILGESPDLIIHTNQKSFLIEHTSFHQGGVVLNDKGKEESLYKKNERDDKRGNIVLDSRFSNNVLLAVQKKVKKLNRYYENAELKNKKKIVSLILLSSDGLLLPIIDVSIKIRGMEYTRYILYSKIYTKEVAKLCKEHNLNLIFYVNPIIGMCVPGDKPLISVEDEIKSPIVYHRTVWDFKRKSSPNGLLFLN